MDLLRWLFRGIRSKRGSPTVEYVFVMVAATMLAGIVVGIVKSEPVQASLRQVILCSVPFLYDENGEPSCKAGKYMAKEDPKPEKPDPPEDEFSPIPLHTKPEPTPPVKPVKSDPSWYECALSWDCIKKKGGELLSGPSEEKKKQLREERIKRLLEEARKHCGNDQECMANYVGKRIGYDQMGTLPQLQGLIGFSKLMGAITGVDPFYEWVSFGMDHPEFTIGLAATIIALFVSPPLGGTMLVSGAISGGVSWLQGNDSDTILRDMGIGGFAGVFGYGVFAGVSRYAGAKLAQSTLNPFLQKWLPKIIGGGSGGVADQSTFDWLRDRKLDWRSATIAGMIGLLIPYAGAIIDGAPALSKSFQQMIPGVSGDGTLAMPWVKKNGQEAAGGYNKASGNGGGGGKSNLGKPATFDEVAEARKKFGLPLRSGDDDPYTVAIARGDGYEFASKNAHGNDKEISKNLYMNAVSPTHAEADVMYSLFLKRKAKGIVGGKAVITVDKKPCGFCKGALVNMVEQSRLDELQVIYIENGKKVTQTFYPKKGFERLPWSVPRDKYKAMKGASRKGRGKK
ncbi:hypothetical protein JOD24_000399 [Kroppenstedtia sanguinis]|uniref:DUF4244 domain-containing protein n=1 Tax=Kroppenstedtia sanguinis TaxID=1380684 RepID=UPI003D24196F